MLRLPRLALALCLGLIAMLLVPHPGFAQETEGTATARPNGLSADDPVNLAFDYVEAERETLGLQAADLDDLVVTDSYTSRHNGVTHVFLRQRLDGLEVLGANAVVNITADGEVLHANSDLLPALAESASGRARLSPAEGAEEGARALDLEPTSEIREMMTTRTGGPERATLLTDGGISEEPIPAKLVWQPTDDGALRLAWNVDIVEPSGEHAWNASIDAETGELLDTEDYVSDNDVREIAAAIGRTDTGGETSQLTQAATTGEGIPGHPAGHPGETDGASYRVYPMPYESPYDGDRTLVVDPADPLGSPFGWHDVSGTPEPDYTRTRGNNVHAYTDTTANNQPDPGSDPDGGSDLVFDFPLDLGEQPETYADAAVTNLFYWNNIVHDVTYRYGFDEASGNFQVNNYGRGGIGGDDVRAEAQDGGGMNNANFFTPVDGNRPRMQMYLWDTSSELPNIVTVDEGPAAGTYQATSAAFGPGTTEVRIDGEIVLAEDGTANPNEACSPLVGFPEGAIALVYRGTCPFADKVLNAQNAGAVAVIVGNNAPGAPILMGGANPAIEIPSVMVTQADANTIRDGLPASGGISSNPFVPLLRDGDLDAGIIIHEYAHGISNRLTGGPLTNCLSGQQQMGEGWSDWYAKAYTTFASESGEGSRGIGTYALDQGDRSQRGIRPTAYSTDMSINPATYGDITGLAVPHGVGYVWSTMLWEVYWDLVDRHGFNPDVYDDWSTGGNNLAIQLVTDGLKMQGCFPGFVDGRDAILAADEALTGGENYCTIYTGFAKRGLGASAVQGPSSQRNITEAFDMPANCFASAEVEPEAFALALVEGDSEQLTLTITNDAALDAEALEWTLTTAEDDCDNPTDLDWISFSTTSGTTAGGDSDTVTITVDADGLTAPDLHDVLLCLSSNDEDSPLAIPLALQVQYPFGGFTGPLAGEGMHTAQARSTIPAMFSLDGDRGLSAIDGVYSQRVDCTTLEPIGDREAISMPGNSGISYDASDDEYNVRWQTDRSWSGTCRALIVDLDDGSEHVTHVRFR